MKINCVLYTVKMNKPNNLYPTDRTKKVEIIPKPRGFTIPLEPHLP